MTLDIIHDRVNTMIEIKREGTLGIIIRITSKRYELSQEDVEAIRNSLVGKLRSVTLTSGYEITISDRIFDNCTFERLRIMNIILGEQTMISIPEGVNHLRINCKQPYLSLVKVSELRIGCTEEQLIVPLSVEKLAIYNCIEDMTIYSHDNLETFILEPEDKMVTLLNCNNLQELEMMYPNSFIYGEFLNYLGFLKTSYNMHTITNIDQYIDKLCEYLSMFKNLQSYDGYINKRIIHALGPIKKASLGLLTANIDIDDIPDSLEDANFRINGINSSDILKQKPNIKRILYSESKSSLVLEDYPNVYFHTPLVCMSNVVDAIKNHNKKLVSLTDLLTVTTPVKEMSDCTIL